MTIWRAKAHRLHGLVNEAAGLQVGDEIVARTTAQQRANSHATFLSGHATALNEHKSAA